jgi:hypothetical protein
MKEWNLKSDKQRSKRCSIIQFFHALKAIGKMPPI